MSTLLSPPDEYEVLPVPVRVMRPPALAEVLELEHTHHRNQRVALMMAGIVGSVAGVGAWSAMRQPEQATGAVAILPGEQLWAAARIMGLDDRSMQLITPDGRTEELALDFGYTSVFQEGGVLSIAHLRPGQQVRVLAGRRAGQVIAKAIAVVPQHPAQLVN